jgi:hypothetical protein
VAETIHVYYKRFSKLICHIEGHGLRVFVSGVLRAVSGPVRDEVTGFGGDCIITGVYYLYCSPNIIWVTESSKMGWARHAARMGRGEKHRGIWWGNLKSRDDLKDLDGEGWVLLKWIFEKY